jgi:hypothetical protein
MNLYDRYHTIKEGTNFISCEESWTLFYRGRFLKIREREEEKRFLFSHFLEAERKTSDDAS